MNLGKLMKKIFNPKPTVDYVSDIDKFLQDFDSHHDNLPSQVKEIEKHKRIAYLRDNKVKEDFSKKIWEDF